MKDAIVFAAFALVLLGPLLMHSCNEKDMYLACIENHSHEECEK